MSEDQIWTECKDFTRESREYWETRLEKNKHRPFSGMFMDSPALVQKMDHRNLDIIDRHINELKKHFPDGLNVLEAGCGQGRYIPMLADRFKKYCAFDFAMQNFEDAKKLESSHSNVQVARCDMKEAAKFYAGEEFHIIFMVSTLTSIQRNFQDIISSMRKILHPNGVILTLEQDMSIVSYGSDWNKL